MKQAGNHSPRRRAPAKGWIMTGILAGCVITPAVAQETAPHTPLRISGRYPHLAMFNNHGECGTGAVVPWADRLWAITYAPHELYGSSDKLYEIDADLQQTIRPESVGGTPANRLIHRESNQLFIGPYVIDAERNVRAISPKKMPGRLTATARHLTDPAGKVYTLDMEGTLYEIDVKTLDVTKLFDRVAVGAHAKGGYTAQGRLVIANNGDAVENKAPPEANPPGYKEDPESSGALAEWDGTTWTLLEGRQFTEVTGPGGIEGATDDAGPLWSVGWDKRSVLLKLLDGGQWSTFRLPVADYSYTAKHGWHTEWPRIRDVGGGKLLMNMHGAWFDFPQTFSAANTSGLRPVGNYLKITADFAPWKDGIVFACDDAARDEFRGGPASSPLVGQSQSNLWFSTWAGLSEAGRAGGTGGPWLGDDAKAGAPSEPYLFAGYDRRVLHLSHASDEPVTFNVETGDGRGNWAAQTSLVVPPRGAVHHVFAKETPGEWVRLTADRDCTKAVATFAYAGDTPVAADPKLFAALPGAGESGAWHGGSLRLTGKGRGTLLYRAETEGAAPKLYEITPDMAFAENTTDAADAPAMQDNVHVSADDASIILTEDKRRVRLPRSPAFDSLASVAGARVEREVVTERSLLNAGGAFYMLPRGNSGGIGKLKPIATHDKQITDFCSWRGLLVIAGTREGAAPDGHYFGAAGGPGLWFGDIDDLWKLGKPRGHGGPWRDTAVEAGRASDAYLMADYDKKSVTLSHDAAATVKMTIEVDPAAAGFWQKMHTIDVPAGETITYTFPDGYSAHWARVRSDTACRATAQFLYE